MGETTAKGGRRPQASRQEGRRAISPATLRRAGSTGSGRDSRPPPATTIQALRGPRHPWVRVPEDPRTCVRRCQRIGWLRPSQSRSRYSTPRTVRSKGLSETASLHDNLIIEDDNLAALKALLPTHQGKVKCIYIDPPYNTGNEAWAYNDNVNSPMMQDWLGKVVDREDLTRHDKWCCMMLLRLKLLRELLSEDGAIFVSIDDNEVPSASVSDG